MVLVVTDKVITLTQQTNSAKKCNFYLNDSITGQDCIAYPIRQCIPVQIFIYYYFSKDGKLKIL